MKNKKMYVKLLVLILLIFVGGVYEGNAQYMADESMERHGWVDLGLGGGTAMIPGFGRIAALAQYTLQNGHHMFSLRALSIFRSFSDGDQAQEIGVLYGRVLSPLGSGFKISVSGGLALTKVYEEGVMENTIGAPLELKLSLRISKFFGIAFSAFANLNKMDIYKGVLVSIQLGKL